MKEPFVTVRIPVYVDPDGDWIASGASYGGCPVSDLCDEDNMMLGQPWIENGAVMHHVVAKVTIPSEPSDVEGESEREKISQVDAAAMVYDALHAAIAANNTDYRYWDFASGPVPRGAWVKAWQKAVEVMAKYEVSSE